MRPKAVSLQSPQLTECVIYTSRCPQPGRACGSHGSSAERGDCSPWGPRNPKVVVTGRALSLQSCCTRLVRLYLQMCFSVLAAVRGHQEHQQCGLCSKDTARRGSGEEADLVSMVHARRRLLHLVGRGLPVWAPGGFPLSICSYSEIPHQSICFGWLLLCSLAS